MKGTRHDGCVPFPMERSNDGCFLGAGAARGCPCAVGIAPPGAADHLSRHLPDDRLDQFDYAFHDERNRAWIASARHEVLHIALEGENIGCLILVKGNPLQVQLLHLLEAYRGRGYGREAMAFIREACRRHGAFSFSLTCHPRNGRALGWAFL